MRKRDVTEAWRKANPSIDSWLNRLAPGSQRRYLDYAYDFFQWLHVNGEKFANKTPAEVLDMQDAMTGRTRFHLLSLMQQWVQAKNIRVGTKVLIYSGLRSFFEHSHVPLPKDSSFRFTSTQSPVTALLSVSEFRRIVLSANILYQFVFMAMCQGLMGENEFIYANENCWPEIEPQLHQGRQHIKITLPGRKKKRNVQPFFTFWGKDAAECLRRYLAQRGPIKHGEAICLGERGKPLGRDAIRKYFHWHAVRVGVLRQHTPMCPECGAETRRVRSRKGTGTYKIFFVCNECGVRTPASKLKERWSTVRYGAACHEIRDLARSEWQRSKADPMCAELFMGHVVDRNFYLKIMQLHPEYAESEYTKAEPYLNILSVPDPDLVRKEYFTSEIEKLRRQVHELAEALEEQRILTRTTRRNITSEEARQFVAAYKRFEKRMAERGWLVES